MEFLIQVITVSIGTVALAYLVIFLRKVKYRELAETRKQRIFWVYSLIWLTFVAFMFPQQVYIGNEEALTLLISCPLTILFAYKTFLWIKNGKTSLTFF